MPIAAAGGTPNLADAIRGLVAVISRLETTNRLLEEAVFYRRPRSATPGRDSRASSSSRTQQADSPTKYTAGITAASEPRPTSVLTTAPGLPRQTHRPEAAGVIRIRLIVPNGAAVFRVGRRSRLFFARSLVRNQSDA